MVSGFLCRNDTIFTRLSIDFCHPEGSDRMQIYPIVSCQTQQTIFIVAPYSLISPLIFATRKVVIVCKYILSYAADYTYST